ncbi:extracellular solute-binding protein [Clostridium estertheticum]|uniref:extracellular solute-binding protein n=1 Tax=Clostridium estertheticum TaxID=238834 RepID=UPI001CF54FC4|nr:extracellular solute-binding protein [Clostridium estertheticum]MCB2340493.1 extracellular solute-binding protein [Clostridium estertheticum]
MNKKLLKIVSVAMLTTVIVSSLAGCGSSKESADSTSDSSVAVDAPYKKQVEIKIPIYDRGIQGQAPVDNNHWTKYVNDTFGKKYNVKVTYVTIPRTTDVDKFNMLLASGDAPDIIFSYDYTTASSFYTRGAFQEVTKAKLDKYAPNLEKTLGADVLKYGAFDGKQMLIPAKRPLVGGISSVIRQDWLDKLGMKVPTNRDEYYAVLKAFKEKDPGKVGANNVIPQGLSSMSAAGSGNINYAFRPANVSAEEFAMYSDVVIPSLSWKPTEDTLKWDNKLFNEGLISPEFVLDKDGTKLQADISNGKVGVFLMPLKTPPVLQTLVKNVPTAKFTVLPATALLPAGQAPQGFAYAPYGMLSGINKKCEHPDAVLKYMDWMSKSENLFVLQNGVAGKNYNLKGGLPVEVANYAGEDKLNFSSNKDMWALVTEQKEFGSLDKNLKMDAIAKGAPGFEKLYIDGYKETLIGAKSNFMFNKPVTSLTKNSKTLGSKWEEASAKIVMGKVSEFDALYAKYSKDYLTSGYQEIINERKSIYEGMKK